MAGPPFDRLKPGQRQVPASLINDALTEIERLGSFYSGEGAQAALQAIGGLPPRILARITATDGGTPPKYSWDLLRNDGTGYFVADPMAGGGVPTFYPLVEINSHVDVPVGAVVEAWPSIGAEQFEFFDPSAAAPSPAGGFSGCLLRKASVIMPSGATGGPSGIIIPFTSADVEDYDTDNYHDPSLNNTRLTCPSPGAYEVGYSARIIQSSNNCDCAVFTYRDGSADLTHQDRIYFPIYGDAVTTGNNQVAGKTKTHLCTTGTTFELAVTPIAPLMDDIQIDNISFWITKLGTGGGGGGGGGFTGSIGGP